MPAAIMGSDLFDSTRPMYLNFGLIGSIIGHELTHGFDTTGSQYDESGENVVVQILVVIHNVPNV